MPRRTNCFVAGRVCYIRYRLRDPSRPFNPQPNSKWNNDPSATAFGCQHTSQSTLAAASFSCSTTIPPRIERTSTTVRFPNDLSRTHLPIEIGRDDIVDSGRFKCLGSYRLLDELTIANRRVTRYDRCHTRPPRSSYRCHAALSTSRRSASLRRPAARFTEAKGHAVVAFTKIRRHRREQP